MLMLSTMKQFLALVLCGLLAYPLPGFAQSGSQDPPDTVLGTSASPEAMSGGGNRTPLVSLLVSGARTGVASSLPIGPISTKSLAEPSLKDYMTKVPATNVIGTAGVQVSSLRTGESHLFEEVSAAAMPPAPSPQIGGGSSTNRGWVLALGIAIVGTSLAIAALVRANDVDDRSR